MWRPRYPVIEATYLSGMCWTRLNQTLKRKNVVWVTSYIISWSNANLFHVKYLVFCVSTYIFEVRARKWFSLYSLTCLYFLWWYPYVCWNIGGTSVSQPAATLYRIKIKIIVFLKKWKIGIRNKNTKARMSNLGYQFDRILSKNDWKFANMKL